MNGMATSVLNLIGRLEKDGFVPVHHQAGLPIGYEQHTLENDDIRHKPDYSSKVHDLLLPRAAIQVRIGENGRSYMVYNPVYHTGNDKPPFWNVIRCHGGEATLTIRSDKPLEQQATLVLNCREAPVLFPSGVTEYKVNLRDVSHFVNSGAAVSLRKIDSDVIVDPMGFEYSLEVLDYGTLITGQKVQPNWIK